MTGGIAYVYDPEAGLASKLGSHAVELLPPDDQDAALIRRLMESHLKHTASPLARRLLAAFVRRPSSSRSPPLTARPRKHTLRRRVKTKRRVCSVLMRPSRPEPIFRERKELRYG